MDENKMKIELTDEELKILIDWGEFSAFIDYLEDDEQHLLEKLQKIYGESK